MRKSRFTEAHIVGIVREYDAGVAVKELSRKHGVHANTIRLSGSRNIATWKSATSFDSSNSSLRICRCSVSSPARR
jgi:hypothetical protein